MPLFGRRSLSRRRPRERSISVISKCLYVGVLFYWSLAWCEELDKLFATEIRRRTKNMKSSQLENLFQPASAGGQGHQRFSQIIQHRKRTSLNRVLHLADHWSRWAADALVRRGHQFPHHLSLPAITPQVVRLGHWITSLIEYGWKGNRKSCITKQLSLLVQRACPPLPQSLVESPLHRHTWSPSN